jgi:hypothetical protein
MGTWIYETWTEPVGTCNGMTVFALHQRNERYVPAWRINPKTHVWEVDPNDKDPYDQQVTSTDLPQERC